MELDELFKFFKTYRQKRLTENLNQTQLLKKEWQLLGAALLTIVILLGLFWALAAAILR